MKIKTLNFEKMGQTAYQYDIFGNKIQVSGSSSRKSAPDSEYDSETAKKAVNTAKKKTWEKKMAQTGRKQCVLDF